MNVHANLTDRETEIAELIAWGLSKKEVASRLFISERTVENHTRSIYEKTGCSKANELSAWWFCSKYKISFDLSPIKRKIISGCMLLLLIPQIWFHGDEVIRQARARKTNTRTIRARRRSELTFYEL